MKKLIFICIMFTSNQLHALEYQKMTPTTSSTCFTTFRRMQFSTGGREDSTNEKTTTILKWFSDGKLLIAFLRVTSTSTLCQLTNHQKSPVKNYIKKLNSFNYKPYDCKY